MPSDCAGVRFATTTLGLEVAIAALWFFGFTSTLTLTGTTATGFVVEACGPEFVFPDTGCTETTAGFVTAGATFAVLGEGLVPFGAAAGTTFTVGVEVFAAGFATTVGDCANAAAAIIKITARFPFIASCLWPRLQLQPAEYHG